MVAREAFSDAVESTDPTFLPWLMIWPSFFCSRSFFCDLPPALGRSSRHVPEPDDRITFNTEVARLPDARIPTAALVLFPAYGSVLYHMQA